MKFHEYRSARDVMSADGSIPWKDFYVTHLNRLENGEDFGDMNNVLMSEAAWYYHGRPFYHVYPSVLHCLQNTSLDLSIGQLGFALKATALCFPVGHEPKFSGQIVRSMIVELGQAAVFLESRDKADTPAFRTTLDTTRVDGKPGFACIGVLSERKLSELDFGDKERLVSLAVGVVMLARDERFCEAILLNRDANKPLTPEQRKVAIERAKRNGRNGIAIGKHLDTSPHMRRPHFGIRWTEKGRSVPKLVPIKGCLVSRSKLYPIPTGYMDDNE